MEAFWSNFDRRLDRAWKALASVKFTILLLAALLLLSIPGTLILQYNISNVDPGAQYDFDFWNWGRRLQLFTSYHSFWYVGLMALLSMNLVACSVERWPAMWRFAVAKPVAWSKETFARQPEEFRAEWRTRQSADEALAAVLGAAKGPFREPVVLEQGESGFQVFWQTGRWSRVANVLVHTSLLVVFLGAILSSLYGFEGAANIPEGEAVDTFLIFKEGKASGLLPAPGGLVNERLLGFRVQAERFDVKFYPDFPGRPSDFVSRLNVIERGKVVHSREIRVNDPMDYRNFVFYQASYGRLGDFRVRSRLVEKANRSAAHLPMVGTIGEVLDTKDRAPKLVAMQAHPNLQNLGPAVQFAEVQGEKVTGKPFWVLQHYPQFDWQRDAPYTILIDDVRELHFTGLQIGYDPGAPIYWLGCFGMLLGTFYALFVQHKKYYLRFEKGRVDFAGSIHRLPLGFVAQVEAWKTKLMTATDGKPV